MREKLINTVSLFRVNTVVRTDMRKLSKQTTSHASIVTRYYFNHETPPACLCKFCEFFKTMSLLETILLSRFPLIKWAINFYVVSLKDDFLLELVFDAVFK